jgi:hypothetical protein
VTDSLRRLDGCVRAGPILATFSVDDASRGVRSPSANHICAARSVLTTKVLRVSGDGCLSPARACLHCLRLWTWLFRGVTLLGWFVSAWLDRTSRSREVRYVFFMSNEAIRLGLKKVYSAAEVASVLTETGLAIGGSLGWVN